MENHKETIYMSEDVYDQIMQELATKKPELGGMLGWTEEQNVIDAFVFDKDAKVDSAEYYPNTAFLNTILNGSWQENGICFGGFVHSHPGNFNRPSMADVEYAIRIMDALEISYIFMPIVTSSYEYESGFHPYIIRQNGEVEKCEVIISKNSSNKPIQELEEVHESKEVESNMNEFLRQDDIFARIRPVIDITHMNECTIIGIGCGGARGFYEDMARVGVGHFYLIDGDTSSLSNIASQNGTISEVGKFKTEVVGNRLRDINAQVHVVEINKMLDEMMTDEWLEENIFSQVSGEKVIICAFTDDFYAQARAEELSVKYEVPYLAAQHHKYGDTSELVYWYPGISEHRVKEILKSRYQSYENGYENDVTSVGSPIFNTTRLNALCAKIATGILMYSKDKYCDYSSFLRLKAECNLILIRQKYLGNTESRFKDVFEDGEQHHFDDVLWINPRDVKKDAGNIGEEIEKQEEDRSYKKRLQKINFGVIILVIGIIIILVVNLFNTLHSKR